MPNTLKCGQCKKYHAIEKPIRSKTGGKKNMKRGYCLARTIFAKNRPENDVYPIGAVIRDLPYGQHKIYMVREDNLELSCPFVEAI